MSAGKSVVDGYMSCLPREFEQECQEQRNGNDMPSHTERNTSVWRTLRDGTDLPPCEIRLMTYMAGQQGHMIDHDVCLMAQDVRDITHPILSEIRLYSSSQ